MKHIAARYGACLALAILSTSCGTDAIFITPSSPAASIPATPIAEPPAFPSVARPARVFLGANSTSFVRLHGSAVASRYVLYDDGSFALQYASVNYPFFEYRGTYREASSVISFDWEGWSVAGPWGATGSLSGDALSVRYNLIMQLSDFEDAVYTRDR